MSNVKYQIRFFLCVFSRFYVLPFAINSFFCCCFRIFIGVGSLYFLFLYLFIHSSVECVCVCVCHSVQWPFQIFIGEYYGV